MSPAPRRRCSFFLADDSASAAFGAALAPHLRPGMVLYLEGDLGAGKTSIVRAMLRALGHQGAVKSPTFALVEVYVISSLYFYHFDFYRFSHPEEFIDAGLEEYFNGSAVCLIEWPAKAAPYLPPPDIVVALSFADQGRSVDVLAQSSEGETCLLALEKSPPALPP